MSPGMRWSWWLLPVAASGVAFATTRGGDGSGERGDADAVAAAKAAAPAVPAPGKSERSKRKLDGELATALYRVGLQPERLAVAGVEATTADDVVAAVKSWLAENPTKLADVDQRMFEAVSTRDKLIRKVRSGLASQEEVAACQTAKADHDRVAAERTATLKRIFDAGTRGMLKEQYDLLTRVQTNAAAWNVAIQYLVVDRTQEEWVRLRAALANEKISAKYGEDPDAEDQAHLADVRAATEVVTAQVNLDTKLGAVTDAWEEAAAAEEQ